MYMRNKYLFHRLFQAGGESYIKALAELNTLMTVINATDIDLQYIFLNWYTKGQKWAKYQNTL